MAKKIILETECNKIADEINGEASAGLMMLQWTSLYRQLTQDGWSVEVHHVF